MDISTKLVCISIYEESLSFKKTNKTVEFDFSNFNKLQIIVNFVVRNNLTLSITYYTQHRFKIIDYSIGTTNKIFIADWDIYAGNYHGNDECELYRKFFIIDEMREFINKAWGLNIPKSIKTIHFLINKNARILQI